MCGWGPRKQGCSTTFPRCPNLQCKRSQRHREINKIPPSTYQNCRLPNNNSQSHRSDIAANFGGENWGQMVHEENTFLRKKLGGRFNPGKWLQIALLLSGYFAVLQSPCINRNISWTLTQKFLFILYGTFFLFYPLYNNPILRPLDLSSPLDNIFVSSLNHWITSSSLWCFQRAWQRV